MRVLRQDLKKEEKLPVICVYSITFQQLKEVLVGLRMTVLVFCDPRVWSERML